MYLHEHNAMHRLAIQPEIRPETSLEVHAPRLGQFETEGDKLVKDAFKRKYNTLAGW